MKLVLITGLVMAGVMGWPSALTEKPSAIEMEPVLKSQSRPPIVVEEAPVNDLLMELKALEIIRRSA